MDGQAGGWRGASWSRRRAISPTVTAHLLRYSASRFHLLILQCVWGREDGAASATATVTAATAAAEVHLRLQRAAVAAGCQEESVLISNSEDELGSLTRWRYS